MRTRTRTTALVATAALLVIGAWVTAAVATPGSGDTTVTSSVSGRLDDSDRRRTLKVAQDGVTLMTREATTVTTFDLTYPPGSYSGWHSHPGIVIAVVVSGKVVRQTPCAPAETFGVDTGGTLVGSFTEVGPHHMSNPFDEPAVLSITRIYPTADAATPRIDEPAPIC